MYCSIQTKILNGLPQDSHGSSISHTLYKLLNSVMEPAREFTVRAEVFLRFKQMTHETSIDDMFTSLVALKEKFICVLERFSVATTITVGLLMKLDGSGLADMARIVTDVISLTENMTKFEQEKIYWDSWFTYRERNPQRQCDSSNIEIHQGAKPSEQTPGNCTALPIVENNETKTLNDTCDKPVITSDTLNQDGDVANDVAYRTVPPVVDNNETKILNDTFDKPVITSDTLNQDGDVANDVHYRTISPVVENSEIKTLNDTYDNPVITSDT